MDVFTQSEIWQVSAVEKQYIVFACGRTLKEHV